MDKSFLLSLVIICLKVYFIIWINRIVLKDFLIILSDISKEDNSDDSRTVNSSQTRDEVYKCAKFAVFVEEVLAIFAALEFICLVEDQWGSGKEDQSK